MKVEIDGSKILSQADLHTELKRKLELPEHYGENLDALWDCLTGWIDLPTKIIWKDFSKSKDSLGNYTDKIIELFNEAKEELEGFSYNLE